MLNAWSALVGLGIRSLHFRRRRSKMHSAAKSEVSIVGIFLLVHSTAFETFNVGNELRQFVLPSRSNYSAKPADRSENWDV